MINQMKKLERYVDMRDYIGIALIVGMVIGLVWKLVT